MSNWQDVEIGLVAYLSKALGCRVATRVPGDVETLSRFVRISRGPGSDDTLTDSPLIDVESFTQGYADGFTLAEDARQALLALSGKFAGPVLVDRVRTSGSPMWVDYRNPGTNRFVASYRLEYRQI